MCYKFLFHKSIYNSIKITLVTGKSVSHQSLATTPSSEQPPSRTSSVKSSPKSDKDERPTSGGKSPMFPCYLCGRLFTVNSIYIHEPQCLKKWKVENDKLPPSKRRSVPLKPDIKFTGEYSVFQKLGKRLTSQSQISQFCDW